MDTSTDSESSSRSRAELFRDKVRADYDTAVDAELEETRRCHEAELEEAKKCRDLQRAKWGLPTSEELAEFIPVTGKKQKIHSPAKDSSSAKIRTGYENQFEVLTVEGPPAEDQNNLSDDDMDVRVSTPVQHVRPPLPITIDNIEHPAQLLKRIQDMTQQKIVGRMRGKSIKLYPETPAAYNKIRNLIDSEKLQSFTFQFPEEKVYKVDIRGCLRTCLSRTSSRNSNNLEYIRRNVKSLSAGKMACLCPSSQSSWTRLRTTKTSTI
ncbi:hypothetical protein TNIN_363571 [Trichonephila inaurata madagascariensis]|uniref:Uncharacterized protein n=1 Tax=Trichonephila inaurata madagascariensis TaxID=2747483 RepID=A0A8X7CMY3_9ARAC|nr:hypothetical protein TNIN_363571 [Trichonephila inaurata madagascariensis]